MFQSKHWAFIQLEIENIIQKVGRQVLPFVGVEWALTQLQKWSSRLANLSGLPLAKPPKSAKRPEDHPLGTHGHFDPRARGDLVRLGKCGTMGALGNSSKDNTWARATGPGVLESSLHRRILADLRIFGGKVDHPRKAFFTAQS